MPDTNSALTIAPDGFLWYKGAKLPFKFKRGQAGFEFVEKDPIRAASVGGKRFVVPFEDLLSFINSIELLKQSYTNEGS